MCIILNNEWFLQLKSSKRKKKRKTFDAIRIVELIPLYAAAWIRCWRDV